MQRGEQINEVQRDEKHYGLKSGVPRMGCTCQERVQFCSRCSLAPTRKISSGIPGNSPDTRSVPSRLRLQLTLGSFVFCSQSETDSPFSGLILVNIKAKLCRFLPSPLPFQ